MISKVVKRAQVFFFKILLNRFYDYYLSIIGTLFYILSPRIYGNNITLVVIKAVIHIQKVWKATNKTISKQDVIKKIKNKKKGKKIKRKKNKKKIPSYLLATQSISNKYRIKIKTIDEKRFKF